MSQSKLVKTSMQSLAVLGALFAISILAACGGGSSESSELPEPSESIAIPAESTVEIKNIYEANLRWWAQGIYVFRNQESWTGGWKASLTFASEESPQPQIDFSKVIVVGIMAGWGANGCASLSILRAVEEEYQIRIEYLQSDGTPPPGTSCTMSLVQLVSFVQIPYTTKPITFSRIKNEG